MKLYNETCRSCSELITKAYSTSFSMGIRMFAPRFRQPIAAVYGFVRFADEIVDSFHGYDKASLLRQFKEDTYRALDERVSLNPVLHAFQEAVHKYSIDRAPVAAFFWSMEMDLYHNKFHGQLYKEYIYGSAEVIGLMCLRVFCEGDDALYQRLKPSARALGSAFQKVNFLRDIQADYEELEAGPLKLKAAEMLEDRLATVSLSRALSSPGGHSKTTGLMEKATQPIIFRLRLRGRSGRFEK